MIFKKGNIERIVPDEAEHIHKQLINDGYSLLEKKQQEGTVTSNIDLNKLTVDQLKELAKEKEIEGISNMKKEDLIKALEGGE